MSDFNLSLNPEDPLIKHAFRGTSFAVVRLEELKEITNLKADAVACYRPANSQELFAVERMAVCQQAILRGYRLESGLFTVALDYALDPTCHTFRPMNADLIGDGDIEITRAQNRNYAAAEGVRQMATESDVWTLLIRYQVNADRQYRRAIEDYERVKRLRPEMPNQPVDSQPELKDTIASFRELGREELEPRPPEPPSGHSQPQPVSTEPVAMQPAMPDFTPAASSRARRQCSVIPFPIAAASQATRAASGSSTRSRRRKTTRSAYAAEHPRWMPSESVG
jgi:hypothetical protein